MDAGLLYSVPYVLYSVDTGTVLDFAGLDWSQQSSLSVACTGTSPACPAQTQAQAQAGTIPISTSVHTP